MIAPKENMKRFLDYREKKSKELKRYLTLSEALALWFSQAVVRTKQKKEKNKEYVLEELIIN